MTERKPRIEDVVSALTARLASAHEIRVQVARLQALASAQEDEARDHARAVLGDVHGESLFQTIRTVYDHGTETGSRVGEVPGLLNRLAAPWERPDAASVPSEAPPAVPDAPSPVVPAIPAAALPPPVREVAPEAPAPVAAADSGPVREPDVPAPDPAPPAVQAVPATVQGAYPGGAAADKIIRTARELVATGDASHYDTYGTKWVGVHQWRRDLFRSAFAEAARAVGLALPADAPASVPDNPVPAPAAVAPPVPAPPRAPGVLEASVDANPEPAAVQAPARPAAPPRATAPSLSLFLPDEPLAMPAVPDPAGSRDPPDRTDAPLPHPDLLDVPGGPSGEFDGEEEAYRHDALDEEDDVTFGADEETYVSHAEASMPHFERPEPVLTASLAPVRHAPPAGLPDFLLTQEEEVSPDVPAGAWPDVLVDPPRRPVLPLRPMLPLKVAPGLRRP